MLLYSAGLGWVAFPMKSAITTTPLCLPGPTGIRSRLIVLIAAMQPARKKLIPLLSHINGAANTMTEFRIATIYDYILGFT